MKKKILLTGAAGGVGGLFRDLAGDRFACICFDRKPTPGVPDAIVGDLTDLPALERAAAGCAAIVHLGAFPNPADFLSVILPSNIIGTYNVLEAARRVGVKRVVLASSIQVEWGHPEGTKVSVDMAPNPSNVYAASKAFAESIGHVYHRAFGLEVVCLRLGLVAIPAKIPALLAMGAIPSATTLTAADCAEIISRAVETPGIGFVVLPAYSRNAQAIRDLTPLESVLGYAPREDAWDLWSSHPRVTPRWLRWNWWRWRSRYFLMRARAWPGRVRRRLAGGRPVRRILVTGSAGYVGSAFRKWAKDRFEMVCFDRRPTPGVPDAIVGELSDRAAVDRAMRSVDAVLHLGGFRDDADFMTVLLPNNVIGTWNIYAAAAEAGVRRVVFASSVQAEDGRPRDAGPVSVTQPPRPTNLYAACKILGEDLGRAAAFRLGLPVIALRLGWVQMAEDPEWIQREGREPSRITLTVRDACEIFSRALTAPSSIRYALLPAYSRNAAAIKDLAPLMTVLGYEPQDDAIEIHRRKSA